MAQYWIRTDSKTPFTEIFTANTTSSIVDDGGDDVYQITSDANTVFGGASLTDIGVVDQADGAMEIMACVRASNTVARGSGVRLCFPSGGTDNTTANQLLTRRNSSNHLIVVDWGGVSNTASLTSPLDYHWVSLRLTTGDAAELRAWSGDINDAGSRPSTADVSVDVSSKSFTRSGVPGLFTYLNSGDIFNVKAISVGTAGDAAPTGPVGGTIPTLSAPGVTELGSTSVRPQITLTF